MNSSNSSIPSRSYWHVVARQLRQEPVAMASAVVLLLIICAAVFAPWVAPADPFKASMLAAAIMLASFAGFYTAIVMVR